MTNEKRGIKTYIAEQISTLAKKPLNYAEGFKRIGMLVTVIGICISVYWIF